MTNLRFHRFAIGVAIAGMLAACGPGGPATAAPTVASSPSAAVLPAGFPLGIWTTTITESDLRTGGVTLDGELTENSGVFTMTLGQDGTWTVAQETDAPIRWPVFRGTYSASGATTFEQVTTFPPDFAGDVVAFEWRVEGGNLLLEVPNPPDHILPVIMELHPWEPAG